MIYIPLNKKKYQILLTNYVTLNDNKLFYIE